MKKFKVITNHDVYVDSYEQGEGESVNMYTQESEQESETIIGAVKKHYENVLCFDEFKDELAQFEEGETTLYYSNLVDQDNYEATTKQIDKWKKNKIKLYSNNITFEVFELIPQTF